MKYQEKLKHAENVANDILSDKSLEQIKSELKEKGLYDTDIINIIASARNKITEKLGPLIRQSLIDKVELSSIPEISKIDELTLEKLVQEETLGIVKAEKKRVKEWFEAGEPTDQILAKIKTDFYPKSKVVQQVAQLEQARSENSPKGRMIFIGGGIGLRIISLIIMYMTMKETGEGLLFYGGRIIGF